MKLKKPWEIWKLRVESFRCFYPILGRSYIFFFRANCCGQQSIKGEEWRFTTGLYECHRALFRGGGGERSCKVYIDTAKIFAIRFEFSPIALETLTSHRNKYHCVRRYSTFTCYLQFSRKPRPCSSQCAKTNWKPQETKQHHSTERDRNGNQLEALSSCNLRKKEKQMTNVAFLPS